MEGREEGLWKVEGWDCGRWRGGKVEGRVGGGIVEGRGEELWKVEGRNCGR